ncbi:MAG: HAMP domain-containing protein [Verrucomicrobia bacterium]|nr:HAMP domain-containing protein [Verrucomicrobiota bacterium]
MLCKRFFCRVYFSLVALVVVTAVVVGVLVSRRIEADALHETGQALRSRAELLADMALQAFAKGGDPTLQARVATLGRQINTRLTVMDKNGAVVADSESDPGTMDNHGRRAEVLAARQQGVGLHVRYSDTLHTRMMYLALAVEEGNVLYGFVRTSLPLTAVQERLRRVRLVVLLGGLIGAGAAAVIGVFVARRVTEPLRAMTRVAKAIAAGDYTQRAHVQTPDEIGQLAAALDRMSSQLRERMERITADRNEVLAILASMVEGVVAVDRHERVVHMNAAAGEILGTTPDASTGRHVWEVTRLPGVNETIAAALKTAAGVTTEATLTADRVVEMQAAPLRDAEGALSGAVVVLHDVTRLRQLETVRRDFVANVSHELKTPLTAIQGLVETLLDDESMDDATRRRFLTKLQDQAHRLAALTADLLVLSRVESRDTALELKPSDVRQPIDEAVHQFGALSEHKKVKLAVTLPDRPVVVLCEPNAVRQLIENLLDNAIKFTPEGGRVEVRLTAEGDEAVLEVADTGIGIEPRDQARIFERFYRVDKARSRELGGTGLGLSIVKHIAEAHGGRVTVESAPGLGSTFRVRFTLAQ